MKPKVLPCCICEW